MVHQHTAFDLTCLNKYQRILENFFMIINSLPFPKLSEAMMLNRKGRSGQYFCLLAGVSGNGSTATVVCKKVDRAEKQKLRPQLKNFHNVQYNTIIINYKSKMPARLPDDVVH